MLHNCNAPSKSWLKNTNAGYHGASMVGKLINEQGFNIHTNDNNFLHTENL